MIPTEHTASPFPKSLLTDDLIPPVVVSRWKQWWHQWVRRPLECVERWLIEHYLRYGANEDGISFWGTMKLAKMFSVCKRTLLAHRQRLVDGGMIKVLTRAEKLAKGISPHKAAVQVLYWPEWIELADSPKLREVGANSDSELSTPTLTQFASEVAFRGRDLSPQVAAADCSRKMVEEDGDEAIKKMVDARAEATAVLTKFGCSPHEAKSILKFDPQVRINDASIVPIVEQVARRIVQYSQKHPVESMGGLWREALRDWRNWLPEDQAAADTKRDKAALGRRRAETEEAQRLVVVASVRLRSSSRPQTPLELEDLVQTIEAAITPPRSSEPRPSPMPMTDSDYAAEGAAMLAMKRLAEAANQRLINDMSLRRNC